MEAEPIIQGYGPAPQIGGLVTTRYIACRLGHLLCVTSFLAHTKFAGLLLVLDNDASDPSLWFSGIYTSQITYGLHTGKLAARKIYPHATDLNSINCLKAVVEPLPRLTETGHMAPNFLGKWKGNLCYSEVGEKHEHRITISFDTEYEGSFRMGAKSGLMKVCANASGSNYSLGLSLFAHKFEEKKYMVISAVCLMVPGKNVMFGKCVALFHSEENVNTYVPDGICRFSQTSNSSFPLPSLSSSSSLGCLWTNTMTAIARKLKS